MVLREASLEMEIVEMVSLSSMLLSGMLQGCDSRFVSNCETSSSFLQRETLLILGNVRGVDQPEGELLT